MVRKRKKRNKNKIIDIYKTVSLRRFYFCLKIEIIARRGRFVKSSLNTSEEVGKSFFTSNAKFLS